MILANWKDYLLAGLIASLLLTVVLLNRAYSNLAEKTAVIESMQREAQAYQEKSETIAKEIGDAIPRVVEQAKAEAWRNYKAKYGMGNAACGIRADGLRLPTGTGETHRTEGTDAASGEQLVIESCARDAGRLNLWIEWAKMNQLPVE